MNSTMYTYGQPLEMRASTHFATVKTELELPVLEIRHIGERFRLVFSSADEMIAFCKDHNFDYEDKRTAVQRKLDAQKEERDVCTSSVQ